MVPDERHVPDIGCGSELFVLKEVGSLVGAYAIGYIHIGIFQCQFRVCLYDRGQAEM